MPSENNMPSGPMTPVAHHQGTSPVPNSSCSPNSPLIRPAQNASCPTLHLTPDPEMELPPKPPKLLCLGPPSPGSKLQGLGMPVQSPQGSCWLRVGMGGWFLDLLDRDVGHGEEIVGFQPMSTSCSVLGGTWKKGKKRVPPPVKSETEEEEDVPLDSDMEQVSGKNLATYSAQASTHPLNTHLPSPRRKPTAPGLF